jgi:hypothetical protein
MCLQKSYIEISSLTDETWTVTNPTNTLLDYHPIEILKIYADE